jgi:ferredoxin
VAPKWIVGGKLELRWEEKIAADVSGRIGRNLRVQVGLYAPEGRWYKRGIFLWRSFVGRDIYRKLARHLDRLPGGYPATASGVELRILRRLFSPEEAALALKLSMLPEEAVVIARRSKIPLPEAQGRLEAMARKGLVYSFERRGRPPRYMATQFVIGIWEFHVNSLDPDLIRDVNEYLPTLMDMKTWEKSPQLRTVPVNRSIDVNLEVLPYESAVELVKAQKIFLEAPCICRREHRMVGKGCEKPEGLCLVMGGSADYYERNAIGRRISRDEALEILEQADASGLVLQPSFSKRIANICCCCGCCCQVLKNIQRHPEPSRLVANSFRVSLAPGDCIGCGVCERRCPMQAVWLENDRAVVEPKRCIGCGLCVSTCPSAALSLVRKSESPVPEIPDNLAKAYVLRSRARGRTGQWGLLRFSVRSLWSQIQRRWDGKG